MGKFIKVRETTSMGVLIRKFVYYVPDKVKYYGAFTGSYFNLPGQWLNFINYQNSLPQPSDNISPDKTIMLVDSSFSPWATQTGAPTRNINDLVAGRRFYISDVKYIEIYSITKGTDYWTVVYRFYNGNTLIGSHTNSAIASKYNTGSANRLSTTAGPLLPYCRDGYSYNGGAVYNYIINAYGFTWLSRSDEMNISVNSMQSDQPAWMKTFYDDADIADQDNPYEDAGISEESSNEDANFSEDSDDVEEDAMPTLSAVGTGFATLFTPTSNQLKYLANVMWGSQWWQALQNEVQGIDKMFVSLGIVPFTVTAGADVEVFYIGV